MILSRAALTSPSGCPVTGSLALRGSIGPVVTLRLPLPLAGILDVCVCGTVLLCACVCVGLRCCVRVGTALLCPICVPGCSLCRRCGSYTSLDWPPVWAEVAAVDQCP